MSNVAVLFQFRRAFPQERVGSNCAILNRQFQKTAFSVSIPTGHCRGLRVLLPTKDGFPISIPSWQFPKTAFPVSIPSRQFQKTAFPVSIPSRQFQKTAFPVSIPSRHRTKVPKPRRQKSIAPRWNKKQCESTLPGDRSCPSGDFSTFSAEKFQNDFRRFAQSRIAFLEKLTNTPSIIFSDLLESALNLEIRFHLQGVPRRKNVQKIYVHRERHEMKF